jgi:hypothetical protein
MLNYKLSEEESFQLISEELTRIFSSNYINDLSKKVSFSRRTGKLKPVDFVSLCAFWNDESGVKSLAQLCGLLDAKNRVSLSTEGLNQRFNKAGVHLLKHIFQALLSKQFARNSIPNFHQLDFYRIRILDSTEFELPSLYEDKYRGYHQSGVKIQLEYELLTGEFIHLDVQNGRDSDAVYGPTLLDTVEANDLLLRDLGYFNAEELRQINYRDAYYISRLKSNILLYERIGYYRYKKLDLKAIMEEMEVGEVREIPDVYVKKEKIHIPRLILYKLNDEQTEQRLIRRDKKEKKNGVKVSHRTKNLTRLNIFITNIPYQCVSKEVIQPFYSLRWQVEILFKTWKSLFKINRVKKMKVERFECHLYGTLISLLLSSTLAFQIREALYRKKKIEVSEYRAISIVKEYLLELKKALHQGFQLFIFLIERMCGQVEKNGKKSHRYKKKTVFDILGVIYNEYEKYERLAS